MPAWVLSGPLGPVAVVFSKEEVHRNPGLEARMVPMGSHPSARMLDFQIQQTNAYRYKADRFQKTCEEYAHEILELRRANHVFKKRLARDSFLD